MPSCWGVWGDCSVKIMILEVRFLLTNFDITSTILNLYLPLNKINYYFENFRGGGGREIWALGGYLRAPPPI